MLTQTHTKGGALEIHRILGDKVRLYRRADGGNWHCSTYLDSKEWRKSTKQRSLGRAKDVAEDWYLELCAKKRFGELESGKTFAQAAKQFEKEYEAITRGRRSPKWVQGHKDRIRLHLLPHFEKMLVKSITSGTAQEYRVKRMTKPEGWRDEQKEWKPPARNTLHNEVVTLSMVLKTAYRHGWIEHVPDLSDPYRRQTKVEHRPWFTPNEYGAIMALVLNAHLGQLLSKPLAPGNPPILILLDEMPQLGHMHAIEQVINLGRGYQASLNPEIDDRTLTPEEWAKAADILEAKLGFENLPRAIVLHEKEGREHIHVVWQRFDIETGR